MAVLVNIKDAVDLNEPRIYFFLTAAKKNLFEWPYATSIIIIIIIIKWHSGGYFILIYLQLKHQQKHAQHLFH